MLNPSQRILNLMDAKWANVFSLLAHALSNHNNIFVLL